MELRNLTNKPQNKSDTTEAMTIETIHPNRSPSGEKQMYVVVTIVMNTAGMRVTKYGLDLRARYTVMVQRVNTERVWLLQAK